MSFTDYLGTLGARRVPIAGQLKPSIDSPMSGGYEKINYSYGQKVPTITGDRPGFANTPSGDPGYAYGFDRVDHGQGGGPKNYASGFVDDQGGFLGYGKSMDDLINSPGLSGGYANYAAQQPGILASAQAQRIANEQAAFNLQQQREARRAAAVNSPQFMGGGLTGMAPQQMAPQQFGMGRSAVPSIGRGTGQGLIGGMHRGTGPTGGGQ